MSLNTSAAYKAMMLGHVLKSRIEILVTNGRDSLNLTSEDILRESVDANWRASNNRNFSLGTCYSTSFNFTAFQTMETQIEGNRLTIVPVLFYDIGNNQEEEIPLGVFYCDEPVVYSATTGYECYDAMLLFDAPVTARVTGTAYNLFNYACSICGVDLATTSQKFSEMVNSSQTYVIDPVSVSTWRDAFSYLSMCLGAYCQINRAGKLEVRQFHATPDATLPRHRKKSTAFAGYKTQFAGVKCRFFAEQNFYPYDYITDREGLVLDLGDIPIVENTETVKNAIIKNIFDDVLYDIEYYPCEITCAGDPSIEAGDMITTPDRFGYAKNILLTSVYFKWHGDSTLQSEGGNPKVDAVTTQAKKAQKRAESQSAQNAIQTATYVNAGQITVDDTDATEITSLRFTTNKTLTAIFGAEIPIYSDGDGYVNITYVDSGVDGDTVRARVHEGYNLVTLVNHLYYEANRVVLLQLEATTEPLTVSGTAPELTIAQDSIRSYIFAQGIEVEAPWDGIISISEHVPYVEMTMALYGLTDGVTVVAEVPQSASLSEVVDAITMGAETIALTDTVTLELKYGDWVLRMGMGIRMGMGRNLAPYQVT